MTRPDKLYVVVRRDLAAGQQAVQGIHAAVQFQKEHPGTEREWFEKSNTLAFLQAEDEEALERLAEAAGRRGIRFSAFREPDIGDRLTALALEPRARSICAGLGLALSG